MQFAWKVSAFRRRLSLARSAASSSLGFDIITDWWVLSLRPCKWTHTDALRGDRIAHLSPLVSRPSDGCLLSAAVFHLESRFPSGQRPSSSSRLFLTVSSRFSLCGRASFDAAAAELSLAGVLPFLSVSSPHQVPLDGGVSQQTALDAVNACWARGGQLLVRSPELAKSPHYPDLFGRCLTIVGNRSPASHATSCISNDWKFSRYSSRRTRFFSFSVSS